MKKILVILFIGICAFVNAQSTNYNTEDGYVANGYDVVSYFNGHKPKKGNTTYQTTYDGAKFRFSSQKNITLFKDNPKKYAPQYGGWCAYAIGSTGKKVTIDPQSYEIRNGKLYLFYKTWITDTLKKWISEGPENLRIQADKNWKKLKSKE